jgi:predicted nucleic acid-binding protein
MKLYIDTNIYLAYMSPTSDTKSLKKLKKLIQDEKVDLVLPLKTKQEYMKHFESRITDEKEKLKKSIEKNLIVEGTDKSKEKTVLHEARIKKIKLFNRDIKKCAVEELKSFKKHIVIVKKLIKEIFEIAKNLRYSDETVSKAIIRYAKDLPPKKTDHKFGDAIIWETLKENLKEEIAIISKDGDFSDKLLFSEWKTYTKKKMTRFSALGQFINTMDKTDKISQEIINKEIDNTVNVNHNITPGCSLTNLSLCNNNDLMALIVSLMGKEKIPALHNITPGCSLTNLSLCNNNDLMALVASLLNQNN